MSTHNIHFRREIRKISTLFDWKKASHQELWLMLSIWYFSLFLHGNMLWVLIRSASWTYVLWKIRKISVLFSWSYLKLCTGICNILLTRWWFGVLCFMSLSTSFKSYRVDGRVKMKGCMQWSEVKSWAEFCLQQDKGSTSEFCNISESSE